MPAHAHKRFALFALPLAASLCLTAPAFAQTPAPAQPHPLPQVVDATPSYCLSTPPAPALPIVYTLAPCVDTAVPQQTIATVPPPPGGVVVKVKDPAPLCATALDPDLLQIIRDLLGAPRPTAGQ